MSFASPRKHSVGPVCVALGGVVVDHVEDDLDAGAVQRLDHVPELVQNPECVGAGTVSRVGREERQRGVAPVVAQPGRGILLVEGKYRQQLDGADAEVLKVRDLVDQPRIGTTLVRRNAGVGIAREPGDVHLVDDGLGEWPARSGVALPVIRAGIDDHALESRRGVVARLTRRVATAARRPCYTLAVWIEQHLVAVEAQALAGVVRTIGAKRIQLSRPQTRHEGVPVVVGALGARVQVDHMRGLGIVHAVEEEKLNRCAVLREDAEVDAARTERRTERKAAALQRGDCGHPIHVRGFLDAARRPAAFQPHRLAEPGASRSACLHSAPTEGRTRSDAASQRARSWSFPAAARSASTRA